MPEPALTPDLNPLERARLRVLRRRILAGEFRDDHPDQKLLKFVMWLYATGRLDDGPGTNRFAAQTGTASGNGMVTR